MLFIINPLSPAFTRDHPISVFIHRDIVMSAIAAILPFPYKTIHNHRLFNIDTYHEKIFYTEIGHGESGYLFVMRVVTWSSQEGQQLITAYPIPHFKTTKIEKARERLGVVYICKCVYSYMKSFISPPYVAGLYSNVRTAVMQDTVDTILYSPLTSLYPSGALYADDIAFLALGALILDQSTRPVL